MGNLCSSTKNELTNDEALEIFQVKLDDNLLLILKGDIQETNASCILNSSQDPYQNAIIQKMKIKPEQFEFGIPKLIQISQGYIISTTMILLQINFDLFSKQDLIDAFEKCFEQLYFSSINSMAFSDQCETYSKEIQVIVCECFIEALINEIHSNRQSRTYQIYHTDYNSCIRYKGEFKKQYTAYCKSKYRMIEQSNFNYGDLLHTINEDCLDSQSANTLSITNLIKNKSISQSRNQIQHLI